MSTIMTVPMGTAGWTGTRVNDDGVIVSRQAYSIDGYSPVLVTIRVFQTSATVHTTPLPGGSWWRQPDATQRRSLIDAVLFKEGQTRCGQVQTRTADLWFHRYPIKPAGRIRPIGYDCCAPHHPSNGKTVTTHE